ncbi:MAG: 50S ribosomal protein L21 [Epsilonproteobacteria bacterium 4484_65]|nr:MAG: 50S ribosomal protein L21 [Epsilonproteobacteria bacterium 4484_65]
MYAIIKASGQQFKVQEGDIICFDNMSLEPKAAVEFKEVLGRDKKVIIYKKRRRKDSKLKRGFRRDFTRVRITKIA